MIINSANFHLMLNHWPVILPVLAIILICTGQLWSLRQTRNVGLAFVVAAAVLTVPTYFTGSMAQEVVQNYPEVSVPAVENHRTIALYSSLMLAVIGILCALILYRDFQDVKINTNLIFGILGLLFVATVFMAYTAHVGGLIRHEELTRGRF